MVSIALLQEGAGSGVQMVLWIVMGVFFLMVILGWVVARQGWLKGSERDESPEEQTGHDESSHHQ